MLRIPTPGETSYGVADWLIWAARAMPDADMKPHYASCYGVAEARNDIAEEFLASDCDVLWMLDSDTIPPKRLSILEGIETHPIVCGAYNGFREKAGVVWHVYKLKRIDDGDKRVYGAMPPAMWGKDRFVKVDAAGSGCMLIQRQVLEALPPRPFHYEIAADGTKSTEDMVFCREVGGVTLDTQYLCRHHRAVDLLEARNCIEQRVALELQLAAQKEHR